jgi:hypothetical protein
LLASSAYNPLFVGHSLGDGEANGVHNEETEQTKTNEEHLD